MEPRILLFAGHYGSGKTNIALNVALARRKAGEPVSIVDLDIVNPYFRTKDSAEELARAGIHLVSSPFANSNVDLPGLPAEIYSVLETRDGCVILDIGGDDRGAVALGRYAPRILERGDYDMTFVVNFYRPLTRKAEEALEVMREIEMAGGIPFTSITHNSNLGRETRPEDVLRKMDEADRLSEMSGLPVVRTTVYQGIQPELEGKIPSLFGIHLQQHVFD